MRGSRLLYATLTVCTIIAGLASRRYADHLPDVIATYAGDVLWASMVYWLLATVWPQTSVQRLALTALAVAVFVELSQLVHTPWLDVLRANRFGALVLGQGFLWSDLACYATGVTIAAMCDTRLRLRINSTPGVITS